MDRDLATAAASLGALEDAARRRMYLFIRDQGRPISREEAAREAGISRKLAAFHLDKLVEKGLLRTHYARPAGRKGPGAGRPSKLYEPSGNEVGASLPERRYDLVGAILLQALRTKSGDEPATAAARRAARLHGEGLGREIRRDARMRPAGPERALAAAKDILRRHGFEPYESRPGELSLRNCPFHALARQAPDLVCGLNQAFLEGVLRGLGNETVEASLEPEAGECCVKLRGPAR